MNPQKSAGDRAEREVVALLYDLLGVVVKRGLGAGRRDDCGDIHGLPRCAVQVAAWGDLARAVREKLPETVRQQANAGALFGALFCRRPGGKYVVVMTPTQFADLYREASS